MWHRKWKWWFEGVSPCRGDVATEGHNTGKEIDLVSLSDDPETCCSHRNYFVALLRVNLGKDGLGANTQSPRMVSSIVFPRCSNFHHQAPSPPERCSFTWAMYSYEFMNELNELGAQKNATAGLNGGHGQERRRSPNSLLPYAIHRACRMWSAARVFNPRSVDLAKTCTVSVISSLTPGVFSFTPASLSGVDTRDL